MLRVWSLVLTLAAAAPSALAGPLETAQSQALRGDYAEAVGTLEAAAKAAPGPDVSVALARAYFDVGRYEDAQKALASAAGATTDEVAERRELLVARLEAEQGSYAAAQKRLSTLVKRRPRSYEARVLLGEVQYLTGTPRSKLTEADAIADYYSDGEVTTARDLAWLGRALTLTEYYKNANTVFGEALEVDPHEQLAHYYWAELFLLAGRNEKEADTSLKEVLKRNPNHPGALTLTALIDLSSDNDAAAALGHAQKALAVNPRWMDAHHAVARAYLATEQYAEAMQALVAARALNPRHPRTLALLAGTALLLEDTAGFNAAMKQALAVNKRYAEGWHLIAELVDTRHRYADAVAFERKAIALDKEYWPAWVGLGLGLSRLGDDDEAAKALETAFENDPFDVLAYNLTEFFYDGAKKRMVWEEMPPWRVRFDQHERALLSPLVRPVLARAWEHYSSTYGFRPKPPLHIEYFPDRKIFAVRTVGTPGLAAHGVCFGHVVTLVSPSNADHAWPMVLWHELAHIWHHQMSDGRVPRWFTEGLAELETTLAQPHWKREMDAALYAGLEANKLEGIARFNTMFTQAKSIQDIVLAYYYATQVTRYIHGRWGRAAFPKMLAAWGAKQPTEVVFREVLGLELAEFDAAVREWLRSEWLARFASSPTGGATGDGSIAAVEAAIKAGQWAEVAERLDRLFAEQKDSATLREWRARAAESLGDAEGMAKHCDRGLELEPERESLQKLAGTAYAKIGVKAGQYALLQRLADTREDDLGLMVAAGCLAEELNDVAGLRRFAARALEIAPFQREARVLLAKAKLADGRAAEALEELETALGLPSDVDPKELLTVKARALLSLGRREDARKAVEKYLPPGGDVEDALRKLQEVEL